MTAFALMVCALGNSKIHTLVKSENKSRDSVPLIHMSHTRFYQIYFANTENDLMIVTVYYFLILVMASGPGMDTTCILTGL